MFLSDLNHSLFMSLIKLQNKEKCIFFCAFMRVLIVWPLTEASLWWFLLFRSCVEFYELFSKLEKLLNLKVISRFLGHPRLFLDQKWLASILWPCAIFSQCHAVHTESRSWCLYIEKIHWIQNMKSFDIATPYSWTSTIQTLIVCISWLSELLSIISVFHENKSHFMTYGKILSLKSRDVTPVWTEFLSLQNGNLWAFHAQTCHN